MVGALSRLTRRLWRDRRGVSAVEFAMLAPVLIVFYFALAELCQGFMAQKRVGHVAAVVADLVAQDDVTSTAEINDIFQAGRLILEPFPHADLDQRVSSVTRNSSGQVRVDWSRGSGMSARAANSTVTLPRADMLANGESLIMAEVAYDYESPVDYMMPEVTEFRQTYYLRPRTVDRVSIQ